MTPIDGDRTATNSLRRAWLKRTMLALGALTGLLIVSLGAAAAFAAARWDRTYDVPLPPVRTSKDAEVLARGEYLVRGPAHCVMCHVSSFDAVARAGAGELVPLDGGLALQVGPLGTLYTPNLTPDAETGIGRYSDGQLARLIRRAVLPNGQATLEPLMPFGEMSDADVNAVISYLRAQPPVRHVVPRDAWTLLGKVVKTYAPTFKPRTGIHPPAVGVPQSATRERGAYLARSVANCVGCHTPRDPMSFAAIGPEFSGGMEFEPAPVPGAAPDVWLRSPNLTPHATGALAKFPDRQTFIARFRLGGRQHAGSPMPWEAFKRMSDDDLGALYEFLRTVPASKGPTGDVEFKKS